MKSQRTLLVVSTLVAFAATSASATMIIEIHDIGDSGTTADGTVFTAEPLPTDPSTGTGVFEPFVRTEAVGQGWAGTEQQLGFNTNITEPNTNFDTKGGSDWTRAIKLGEVGVTQVGAIQYYEFLLDSDEEGNARSAANIILVTDVQIYLSPDDLFSTPELSGLGVDGNGYTGTPFDATDNELLGQAPAWSLDNATNGDVDVELQASICASPGQCGSGKGDMRMLIPITELVGSPDDWLVFYVEYDRAANPTGGFDEWSTRSSAVIPEPSAAVLFGVGALVMQGARRRR